MRGWLPIPTHTKWQEAYVLETEYRLYFQLNGCAVNLMPTQ